jgi:hypothetical protein
MTRIHTIGIHEQAAWVWQQFPSFSCRINRGLLICTGMLQPSPVSDEYRVEIHYRTGTWPRSFVRNGQLNPLLSDGRIPHTYSTEEPCLFYPNGTAWRSDMKIAFTIIPWLALWLYYYEVWRATGDWLGGGICHSTHEIEPAA